MFRSSSLSLTIPQPCQQAWEDMTPDGTGKFCSSCNKTVVDFTNLSDEEVLAIIQKSTSKVCGRFLASQLDRKLYQQKRNQNTLLPAVMISSALIAGTTANGMSQSENIFIQPAPGRAGAAVLAGESLLPLKQDTTVPVISGKVIDNDSLPLPGASVRISNTDHSTVTDSNGNFHFNVPTGLASQNIITLEFSFVGFNKQCVNISTASDLQKTHVLMLQDHQVLGETEVVLVGAIQKRTFWQRLKRLFR